jgi:hypothetical protein
MTGAAVCLLLWLGAHVQPADGTACCMASAAMCVDGTLTAAARRESQRLRQHECSTLDVEQALPAHAPVITALAPGDPVEAVAWSGCCLEVLGVGDPIAVDLLEIAFVINSKLLVAQPRLSVGLPVGAVPPLLGKLIAVCFFQTIKNPK